MYRYPLNFSEEHLFVELESGKWLYDTGAPNSFSNERTLLFADREFVLEDNYMGLTTQHLSGYVGMPCQGLLGADVLTRFDHVIDLSNAELNVSSGELPYQGKCIHTSDFMGIPIVPVQIGGNRFRMFFDTGAKISYFQHALIESFPFAGEMTDFYPGFGSFQTEVHQLEIVLGNEHIGLQCGKLPGVLESALSLAGVDGILGNEILKNRIVGYFPGKNLLCMEHAARKTN